MAHFLAGESRRCRFRLYGVVSNVPVSLFLRDPRTDILLIRICQNLEGKLDVTIAAPPTVPITLALLAVIMERPAGLPRRSS